MIAQLSIERTVGGPLAISSEPPGPTGGLWIAEILEPGFEFRYGYAPVSPHMPGQQLLSAVLEQSTLPAVVYAQGTSTAHLRALKDELAAAVAQFAYDVTLAIDGDVQTFSADPTWPQWQQDWGMAEAFMASTSLSIRVNPGA